MFNHRHYVPVLKWKMGEYQALHRLDKESKDRLTPLFEIPPVGFDFETGQDRETIDEHLGDFGRRLKSKWQGRRCFVDLKYIPPITRMRDGAHYLERTFDSARSEGCGAVPVVSLSSDQAFLASASTINRQDRRGICLRLKLDDFDRPAFSGDIDAILSSIGIGWPDVDLVVDLEAPNFIPIAAFVRTMLALLELIPALNRWRTVTIAGTAYPPSVAGIEPPFQRISRNEWIAYRALVNALPTGARIPSFGDYGVAHPDLVELDVRMIKPFAKLRYTLDDAWHVGRGTPVRTHGFSQYREMCAELAQQPYFGSGVASQGDVYIADCARGDAPTGNLSTWVWVATNRHLARVVDDLARFHGS